MSAAQGVAISGLARFGIDYNEANNHITAVDVDEVNLTSRLRLQFDASAVSDAGVTFGGRFRAEANQDNGAPGGAGFNGARLYAQMGPATLQVGNTAGAVDSMPGLYLPTTSIDTGVNGAGFHALVVDAPIDAYTSGGVGVVNGVEIIYSQGGLGFHISSSTTSERVGAHVSYSMDGWTVAVGTQDSNVPKEKVIVGTIEGDLGFAGLGVSYANNQNLAINGDDVNKFRVYGSVPIGAATTLVAWGAHQDEPWMGDKADERTKVVSSSDKGSSFGLDVTHDLGGGVKFVAGVVDPTNDDAVQASAGVFFKF